MHDPLPIVTTHHDDHDWQPLPPRALRLFQVSGALTWSIIALGPSLAAVILLPSIPLKLAGVAAALLLLPGWGLWLARKKYRYTRWRLNADGFGLRRGRFWIADTRVPGSRVQHLDLVRGPLERHFDLATLIIHTAGTRDNAVSISGMDSAEAERLRNTLALSTGQDDD